ncbi:MAG: hypothetical protein EKK53_03020 [Burkholderiales bacterium]|nr:MAG: hypothetical protein EKK53_03020 [Burkholderiales bacterium]
MTADSATYLPKAIPLQQGLEARIELIPMPTKADSGRYRPAPNTDIQVSLFRGEQLVERRRWDSIISGEETVQLADGTVLGPDDIDDLDRFGWDQMLDYGMIPNAFVP